MPLAVSATTRSGRSVPTSTKEWTCSTYSGSRSRCSTRPRSAARSRSPLADRRLDLGQARVLADGRGARPAQLDAVVLGGVVAGGEHRRRRVEAARREVHEVGRDQPESTTSAPARVAPSANAAASGSDDGRMSRPTSTERGAGERDERVPDPPGDVLVELVGVQPADVVGLEDRVESLVAHSAAGYPASPAGPFSAARCCFLRLRHHGQSASPATPTKPATVPTRPRYSGVVVE